MNSDEVVGLVANKAIDYVVAISCDFLSIPANCSLITKWALLPATYIRIELFTKNPDRIRTADYFPKTGALNMNYLEQA